MWYVVPNSMWICWKIILDYFNARYFCLDSPSVSITWEEIVSVKLHYNLLWTLRRRGCWDIVAILYWFLISRKIFFNNNNREFRKNKTSWSSCDDKLCSKAQIWPQRKDHNSSSSFWSELVNINHNTYTTDLNQILQQLKWFLKFQ